MDIVEILIAFQNCALIREALPRIIPISYHYIITVTIITLFDVKSPVKVDVDFETHLTFNVPSTSHSISVFSISIQGCCYIS